MGTADSPSHYGLDSEDTADVQDTVELCLNRAFRAVVVDRDIPGKQIDTGHGHRPLREEEEPVTRATQERKYCNSRANITESSEY